MVISRGAAALVLAVALMAGCGAAESPEPSQMAPRGELDGTWRMQVTAEQLLAVPGTTRTDAFNNAGVWTWVFDRGHGSYELRGEGCDFTYIVTGNRVTTSEVDSPRCGGEVTLTFRRSADTLDFTEAQAGEPGVSEFLDAFYASGMTRIGDPPG